MIYTTSNGNRVKIGNRGWLYLTRNVSYTTICAEQNEIFHKWQQYVNANHALEKLR